MKNPFTRTKKKQLIINCESLETRVALLNSGKLEEYLLERSDMKCANGSVYLGKIVNVELSLQAVFVDIGEERNAFLPFRDMLPATADIADNIKRSGSRPKKKPSSPVGKKLWAIEQRIRKLKKRRITEKDIPELFPAGTEILVQIQKGPIGTKGPRVTMDISIAGRYFVLLPFSDNIKLSKKITDRKERKRLREIMEEIDRKSVV